MLTLAECVLPGHPDKLCDRVADAIVDLACARHPRALVGVEVAVHRSRLFVTGCVATRPALGWDEVVAAARAAVAACGYGPDWPPDPAHLVLDGDLRLEELDEEVERLRSLSDDQAICVGFATPDPRFDHLPVAQALARRAARRLAELAPAHGLGPDGKVILACEGELVSRLSLSLYHRPLVDRVGLFRVAREVAAAVGLFDLDRVEVNGAGDFDVGGPLGDNGLSGKKLVVDAYGPTVPIGGGAWSGKDPHKVDRCGGLRARPLALRVARALGTDARVELGWFPGDRAPSIVQLLAPAQVDPARFPLDLSIDATHRELRLGRVRWRDHVVTDVRH